MHIRITTLEETQVWPAELDAQQADAAMWSSSFTTRQLEVLRAFAAGLSQHEVGNKLSITNKILIIINIPFLIFIRNFG